MIDGTTGLLVKDNNPNSFANALLKLVDNDNLRAEMSVEGWEFVRKKFHYTRLVNDMSELYYRLLNGKHA